MKRILTILVVLALTLGVTAAAESPTGHVRVQLIGNFSMEDTTDQTTGVTKTGLHVIKEDFESKHPGITLEFIIMGWERLCEKDPNHDPGQRGGRIPGARHLHDERYGRAGAPAALYRPGWIRPDPILRRAGGRLEDHGANDAEPTIYALPFLGDTRYICYDKTIFDQWAWSTCPSIPR